MLKEFNFKQNSHEKAPRIENTKWRKNKEKYFHFKEKKIAKFNKKYTNNPNISRLNSPKKINKNTKITTELLMNNIIKENVCNETDLNNNNSRQFNTILNENTHKSSN